jgi:uncharacterized repeat protein (TIGR03803 family)
MRSRKSSPGLYSAVAILAAIFFASAPRAVAQHESLLHSFDPNTREGLNPEANLISDASGNLYSTTYGGGIYQSCFDERYICGTVFELSPAADGGWTEKTIHNFGEGNDGINHTAGVIFDAAGNLYGTTTQGGAYYNGTVFELSPIAGGGWSEKVLHDFNYNGADGFTPYGGVILDASGNLYGATSGGGVSNAGTVFELIRNSDGSFSERILHSFASNGRDGVNPWAGVIVDAAGNLYGTTASGGIYNWGTVFKLSPQADGSWTEKILHNFNNNMEDGVQPYNGLTFDGKGNLYGAMAGGAYGYGVVLELTPDSSGNWQERIVHNFAGNGVDGTIPAAAVTVDASGNIYGATIFGGPYNHGTVFKLTPTADGNWTEKVLHGFNSTDGDYPYSSVLLDARGNIYGTTDIGGLYGDGVVFKITQ